MPQWDFLNFIADQGKRYAPFHVGMQTEVTDLIEERGRIVGVRAKTPNGAREIRAVFTVGADGRQSIVRERAGLQVMDIGAPMDVLWMRFSRHRSDPGQTFGHAEAGKVFVMVDRDEYWQCGFVISKGAADEIHQRGIEAFRGNCEYAALLAGPGRRTARLG
jgi:2-polyprenyl-6-methoxyphenol hydroxylase-like FAD-dependent oxidoreductase